MSESSSSFSSLTLLLFIFLLVLPCPSLSSSSESNEVRVLDRELLEIKTDPKVNKTSRKPKCCARCGPDLSVRVSLDADGVVAKLSTTCASVKPKPCDFLVKSSAVSL
ncbi:Uncharacterized protein Rs2_49492 [Raphanus sativus]|nr:Uncharacterized protein Rs2_49492 [Raphanus sativus]